MKQATVGNRILRALPSADWRRLQPHLEPAEWPLGTFIQEADKPFTHVAFPESGLLSAILMSEQNVGVEIVLNGAEGEYGATEVIAGVPSMCQVTVQVAGHGFLLPADILRAEWERHAGLHRLLTVYNQVTMAHTAQTILCNRLHTTEERLSRWLLQIHDRVSSDKFLIANQFLACMLGVRATGVPIALGILQQAGLIRCANDGVEIIDRPRLEASACECYAVLHRRHMQWQKMLE